MQTKYGPDLPIRDVQHPGDAVSPPQVLRLSIEPLLSNVACWHVRDLPIDPENVR